MSSKDGWNETSVNLQLPATCVKNQSEDHAPKFEVKGVFYRRLIEVIKAAFQDTTATAFHYTPFRLFWRPGPDHIPECVISEMYNSDAILEEHIKLMDKPGDPECKLEKTIAAIMVWSDATHLASFGTASLWPIYVFFGNQSKYTQGKPTSFAAHHLAYIPAVSSYWCNIFSCLLHYQLPNTIQDIYQSIFGHPATTAILTFLKRELLHKIWVLLLDPDFMHAYVHGIVI